MTGRVLVLGSLNVDLVTRVESHPRPGETVLGEGLRRLAGGKGANQAVAAAAAGADVAMAGCVGDDDGGRAYRERLARLGIDVEAVRVVEGETSGHAIVQVSDDGENTIVVVPGANHHLGAPEVGAVRTLGPDDVLVLQLEVPLTVVCEAARVAAGRGARVVLNVAPWSGLPADVVALGDPVVANELEMQALAEAGVEPASLLVTFGANGASWDGVTMPAHPVEGGVVDTTGAGDAFVGALAAALARGATREEALDAALASGAAAVAREGAQPDPYL